LIFADSSFFIALLNKKDQWHKDIPKVLPQIDKVKKITSILVLSETVTLVGSLSGGKAGVLIYEYIIDNYEVIYMDKTLNNNAMEKFLQYDGTLSLADCVSLEIMEMHQFNNIVSFDSDFNKVKNLNRIH
jgi:predicted nucleic acid-binding protein